ncbi:MAG: hypothetical protein ACLFUG_05400 [Nitriliruptoraceae bacterium]
MRASGGGTPARHGRRRAVLVLAPGTYERRMLTQDELRYRRTLHPFMDGMVVVTP